MYSQTDIEEAVAAGAIAPDQAENLRTYIAARNGRPAADEEYFRTLFGYNDLLVSYASIMVLIALALIGFLIPINTPRLGPIENIPLMAPVFAAAGAWGLSELFLQRRAFALTGIVLALALGLSTFLALLLVGLLMVAGSGTVSPVSGGFVGALGAGAACLATFLHWRRFAVPAATAFYLGFGALGIVFVILPVVALSPAINTVMPLVGLLLGVLLFGYAMSWDARDPERRGLASEVGVWVHWPAGTFLALSLSGLFGLNSGVTSPLGGIAAVALFVLFALVGLIINRRQYLLSAMSPLMAALIGLFGIAGRFGGTSSPFGSPYGGGGFGRSPMGSPFSPFAGGALPGTTATFAIIAILLMLTVLFWQPLRRGLLSLTPASWRAHLPATDHGFHRDERY